MTTKTGSVEAILTEFDNTFVDWNSPRYMADGHDINQLRIWLEESLTHLQEQTRREWEAKVAKAVKHGTLPIPNPYGTTVSLRRHNQVVREMKQILDSQESEK